MIEGLRDLGKTIFLTTHYMDEAQHLADRLTILRHGEIVAEGTASQLSERSGGTIIRFELAAGVDASPIQAATGLEPSVSGTQYTLRAEGGAQHVLYQLTGWAEQGGVELEDLEVSKPSLDDVFLELNQESAS